MMTPRCSVFVFVVTLWVSSALGQNESAEPSGEGSPAPSTKQPASVAAVNSNPAASSGCVKEKCDTFCNGVAKGRMLIRAECRGAVTCHCTFKVLPKAAKAASTKPEKLGARGIVVPRTVEKSAEKEDVTTKASITTSAPKAEAATEENGDARAAEESGESNEEEE